MSPSAQSVDGDWGSSAGENRQQEDEYDQRKPTESLA